MKENGLKTVYQHIQSVIYTVPVYVSQKVDDDFLKILILNVRCMNAYIKGDNKLIKLVFYNFHTICIIKYNI